MKRTITMWGVCKDGSIGLSSLDKFRKQSISYYLECKEMAPWHWPRLYRQGYRCRKVKISWEE